MVYFFFNWLSPQSRQKTKEQNKIKRDLEKSKNPDEKNKKVINIQLCFRFA